MEIHYSASTSQVGHVATEVIRPVRIEGNHSPSVRDLIVHLALTEDRLRELRQGGESGKDSGVVAALRREQDEVIWLLHHQPS